MPSDQAHHESTKLGILGDASSAQRPLVVSDMIEGYGRYEVTQYVASVKSGATSSYRAHDYSQHSIVINKLSVLS